jgi:hypothetical protein
MRCLLLFFFFVEVAGLLGRSSGLNGHAVLEQLALLRLDAAAWRPTRSCIRFNRGRSQSTTSGVSGQWWAGLTMEVKNAERGARAGSVPSPHERFPGNDFGSVAALNPAR